MDGFCDLHGKTALVTGSSRGIGFALAKGLGLRGARVVLHGASDSPRLRASRDSLATEGMSTAVAVADLSRPDGPDELARQLGPNGVDILVLNASLQIPKPWDEVADEDMLTQYRIDFMSSVRLVQLLQPKMVERKWGRIVTIGSLQQLRPLRHMAVYSALKSAQENLSRNLAMQFAKDGVTVNNVAPGTIRTDRNTVALSDKDYERRIEEAIPVGFIGEPEDCVSAVTMLCAPESRYITGIDLLVDGGKHLSCL